LAGTNFFLEQPGRQRPVLTVPAGQPLLWQHLFWFLAPGGLAILPDGIVAGSSRQHAEAAVGYRSMVYSLVFLGFMSFIVWGPHVHDRMGRRWRRSSRRPR
jgi:cytochrome c oxidase subunit 1